MITNTAGVILAGGQSKRFGSNKALVDFQGLPLIQRISVIIAPLFSEKLLIANTPDAYNFLGWPMSGDFYPGCGPLAGIHAALSTIHAPRCFITACDMPFLSPEVISFLCGLGGTQWDVVIPWLDEGPEPLCAVYSKSALPIITENLQAGQRKTSTALKQLRLRKVSQGEILEIAPDLTVFYNINRSDDMRNALSHA